MTKLTRILIIVALSIAIAVGSSYLYGKWDAQRPTPPPTPYIPPSRDGAEQAPAEEGGRKFDFSLGYK